MSYCRFSSYDFRCDAHVYEDIMGGFTVHLASSKVIGDIPTTTPSDMVGNMEKYLGDHKRLMDFLEDAEREKIDLPSSGETFRYDTAEECAEALVEFRDIGYRIPQYAIDSLIEETKMTKEEVMEKLLEEAVG